MQSLIDCCRKEAAQSLRRHRHVATCEQCGRLLLAYANDTDYERTIEELADHDVDFQVGTAGSLRVVAYER